MRYRTLGRTGWQVSEIGYGMWGLAGWTGSEDEESLQSLHRAVELGCNFFDTAWAYGHGHSENLLGQLVRSHPDKKLYVASKIPPKNFRWPAEPEYSLDDCYPPDHIRQYVESSLQNLGLSQMDLIQFHTWDDSWASDTRWQRALDDLKQEGLILAAGISIDRWELANAIEALRTGLIDAVQVIYNIFDQNPEDELFPICRELGIGVIARVPFDEGTLTGTLTLDSKWPEGDWRNSYFVPENLKASVKRAEALRPLIPEGMTMPEMALHFILSNPDVSTVIPGMRKLKNVEINIATSNAGGLSSDLIQSLRAHRWDRKPTTWSQ
ncbi:MAG TPA: aldo/keto reductase [Anaerolineales bacterium]|nr:aldo/keto reductase [Anaerolineales bacterium]